MSTEGILQNIARYVDLTSWEQQALSALLSTRTLEKRDFLEHPGHVCHHQTYVVQGALRSYLIADDGSEHTVQFAIEDWWISDFNSYIAQEPATLHVEAIETTQVLQLHFNDAEQLCRDYPRFERYFRLVAQKAFAFAQKRMLTNLSMDAETRFIRFNELYPSIVQRVPQYALASYLGMSAEFLSKVRKRTLRS